LPHFMICIPATKVDMVESVSRIFAIPEG